MEHFNASSPPPPEARNPLLAMMTEDADGRLLRLLGEVEELVEEGRRRDASDGLDPGIEARLAEITGAPDASLEFSSLHRRVAEGRLSWLQFWLQPEQESGGPALISAVMRAEAAELNGLLSGLEEQEEDGPGRA